MYRARDAVLKFKVHFRDGVFREDGGFGDVTYEVPLPLASFMDATSHLSSVPSIKVSRKFIGVKISWWRITYE